MLPEKAARSAGAGSVWLRPWRVLLLGLGVVLVSSLLIEYDGPVVTPVRLLLMVAGLIAGGWALRQRLSSAGEDLDERVESAGMIAVYALYGLIGFIGMAEDWFSGRIFFGFFLVATIIGSLLTLLPRLWRRLAATLLILLHFGGIVTAATCTPATNGRVPWLAQFVYTEFYRPYITGLYFTNPYHFYAPDPGVSTLVWVRVEYEDHQYRWLKFPNRPNSPTPLHYQREMGVCESTSQRSWDVDPQRFGRLLEQRNHIARFGKAGGAGPIPMRDDMLPYNQYSRPNDYSEAILSSMARHVARFYPHPTKPEVKVKALKIYRVTYELAQPGDFLKGEDPLDDKRKLPFYMGEFDTEGRRKRYSADADAKELPPEKADDGEDDPLLYWAIPMEFLKLQAGDIEADKILGAEK
jgi:hypothetical protein